METLIDLIRHGEPVGGRKYRGQSDDPLSEHGWGQMRDAVGEFAGWTAIVSSPLSRCRAFAEELAGQRGLPLAVDDRLKEVGFGVWEGRTAAEIDAEAPGTIARFRADPVNLRPAGAEALPAFFSRVVAALADIRAAHSGGHVLVVCHAGVIRMALAHALGAELVRAYRIEVATASLTRLRCSPDGGAALVFHGGRAA